MPCQDLYTSPPETPERNWLHNGLRKCTETRNFLRKLKAKTKLPQQIASISLISLRPCLNLTGANGPQIFSRTAPEHCGRFAETMHETPKNSSHKRYTKALLKEQYRNKIESSVLPSQKRTDFGMNAVSEHTFGENVPFTAVKFQNCATPEYTRAATSSTKILPWRLADPSICEFELRNAAIEATLRGFDRSFGLNFRCRCTFVKLTDAGPLDRGRDRQTAAKNYE